MTKRATRTNADTLENVRKQAYEMGRADGYERGHTDGSGEEREHIAVTLLADMPWHRENGLSRALAFLQGYHAGAAALGKDSAAALWAQDIKAALEIVRKLRDMDNGLPF